VMTKLSSMRNFVLFAKSTPKLIYKHICDLVKDLPHPTVVSQLSMQVTTGHAKGLFVCRVCCMKTT